MQAWNVPPDQDREPPDRDTPDSETPDDREPPDGRPPSEPDPDAQQAPGEGQDIGDSGPPPMQAA